MLEWIDQLDRNLLVWINQIGSPALDPFWLGVTRPETWVPLYVLFFILIFLSFDRRQALRFVLILILAFFVTLLFTDLVKYTVARPRPNHTFIAGLQILQRPTDYGFFSGHASTSLVVSMLLYLRLRTKWKALALIFLWPLLFAGSRLFVGVHYPSDILAGALAGGILGWIFHRLANRLLFSGPTGAISPG